MQKGSGVYMGKKDIMFEVPPRVECIHRPQHTCVHLQDQMDSNPSHKICATEKKTMYIIKRDQAPY